MALQEHYTYDQVLAILGTKRQANLGSNTYAAKPTREHSDGRIDITFYRTVVAILFPDGRVIMDSGGYRTKSTKDRLNRFAPEGVKVQSLNDEWVVVGAWGHYTPFYDGISV